ncbi:MAG: Fic family protein [Verrucomicrobiales bacterium]
MNPDDFQPAQRPYCQRQPEGYFAFVPPGLPPELPIDWDLAALLSEADRAVAELSGAGRLLPNPHLLIRPYLRREAVLSSLIEDTYAEVDELLLLEAAPDEEPPRPSIREVSNHVRALETGLARLAELPISTRLIQEVHAILLASVRGGESTKTPSEFRRSQNWIGQPGSTVQTATFVPPPPHALDATLSAWENYLHADSTEPGLVKIALLHYQFEAIHPFLDGNGRIGRLLITLFLCARGILSEPLLYLSSFFERYRDEYYRHLFAVSTSGEWQPWITFFLTGVRDTAREALADTRALVDLYNRYRAIMDNSKRVPSAAAGVLDTLFAAPMLSISNHSKRFGEPYHNVSKGVEFWQKHGLVTEITNQRRNRIFAAPEVIELTRPRPASPPH